MNLTNDDIAEYIAAWKEEFGEGLTWDQARNEANLTLELFSLLTEVTREQAIEAGVLEPGKACRLVLPDFRQADPGSATPPEPVKGSIPDSSHPPIAASGKNLRQTKARVSRGLSSPRVDVGDLGDVWRFVEDVRTLWMRQDPDFLSMLASIRALLEHLGKDKAA